MEARMGDLLIRNIPDAMKAELADAAAVQGNSLSQEAIAVLKAGLENRRGVAKPEGPSAWEVLRPIFHDENDPAAGELFSQILDEIEAERKKDFGRPIPDLE
jgi:plasmid stability protein